MTSPTSHTPKKLSVVIITFNEEKNIRRCIESVLEVADDIVVVDSFSTDQTEQICLSLGARFITHAFEGHIEQKNWAASQALYPHILSLDADEALDEQLKTSILAIKQHWQYDGYYMNRLTNYCGKWIKHCGWYPDKKLRLWDSRKGAWGGVNPHDKYEMFEGDKTTHFIKGDILHYSYYTIEEHYKQVYYFTDILAKSQFKVGKKAPFYKLYFSPIFGFIRNYFIRLGILDGLAGLTICRISAYATFLKYQKLKKHIQKEKNNQQFQRIIISRTDAIGDVILSLPLCGIIKKYYPKAHIIFIGRTYTKAIIEHCAHVDEFINADLLLQLEKSEAVDFLKKYQADTIIHIYPKSKIAKLAKLANIPTRIGTSKRTFHLFNINHFVYLSRKNSSLHESQLNCKLLQPLGINIQPSLTEMATFTGFNKGILKNSFPIDYTKKNIILHPKSNASAREWHLDNFKALIQLLPKEKFTFYISGTAKEKEILGDWLKTLPEHVIDITGKFTLPEFISFIAEADFLVAASTGPLHMAAALGIGAIGIYPPLRPIHPGRWQPIGAKATYLVAQKDCNACVKKPKACACMNLVTPQAIAQLIHPIV